MSKRYALLYSSEEYQDAGKTPFCHADRELLENTLTNSCDYAQADVISRKLSASGDSLSTAMLADIEGMRARLQAGDTVVFFYAGHGTSIDEEPYLILPDTDAANIEKTGVSIRDVSDRLRVEGVQCFRIFDSCHSGFDVRDSNVKSEPMMRGVVNRPADGWVTLAGCAPDEACYSSTDEGHGVFTNRLTQAIEETAVGLDVQPEIIKVRTCELVNEWCADSGKQQTPTLIATVRGNISLATRRASQVIVADAESNGAEGGEKVDVKARLAELTGEAPPGSDDYWARYTAAVSALREEVDANLDFVSDYGSTLNAAKESQVDAVLDSIKTGVVDLVYKKGWRPIHHVSKEIEADASPFGSILAISALTSGRSKARSITRELSQEYGTPDSTVCAEMTANGAFPGLRVIHYLCPLQSRFLLYSRIEIFGVMAENKTRSQEWYRTVHTDDLERMKTHAEFVRNKAKEMYYDACETNIEYLESEQA